jgi:S-adenosylmethionine:tRNA ribosyltransferase-isomerase
MQVSLFDFDLPESLIALRPVQPRDQARLLHVNATGQRSDACVADLPSLLNAGDALVVNVTKVIPARLLGLRLREGTPGAKIEFTLTQRLGPVDWKCFLKPAKKVKDGDIIEFDGIRAVISKRQEGSAELHFDIASDAMEATLSVLGSMPLPPYIASKRAPDARDLDDYQTLFASQDGAVAAPTAGLHFTPELVAALTEKGVELHKVTLHVGPGTFVPVKVEDTDAHIMHGEWGQVTQDTATALNQVKAKGGRIVCVGTTSMRLLESATREDGVIEEFEDDTDIFITPGYRFRAVDLLLTNFHLPKSTLFMLISAFSGLETMQSAYGHAIALGYRFYSYGDACLLERQDR